MSVFLKFAVPSAPIVWRYAPFKLCCWREGDSGLSKGGGGIFPLGFQGRKNSVDSTRACGGYPKTEAFVADDLVVFHKHIDLVVRDFAVTEIFINYSCHSVASICEELNLVYGISNVNTLLKIFHVTSVLSARVPSTDCRRSEEKRFPLIIIYYLASLEESCYGACNPDVSGTLQQKYQEKEANGKRNSKMVQ